MTFPDPLQSSESIKCSINQHFAQMHGVLQNAEKDLIEKIDAQRYNLRQNLANIKLKLESHEEVLREGLLIASSVKDSLSKIDLASVTKKLEVLANVPCHLIKDDVTSNENIRFETDKSVIEVIKNHCSIEVPQIASFSLSLEENLPPDYVLEPLTPQEIPSPWESQITVQDSSPTPSVTTSISTTTSRQSDFSLLDKGSTELIRMLHVADPSCFYVQQTSLTKTVDEFHKDLEKEALKNDHCPSDITINKLYIVKYKEYWYRGRVKKVIKNALGHETYEVFFIDYGNTEKVSIQEIRKMSPQFATQTSFAIKCTLYDIEPKEGTWCYGAIKAMNSMLDPKDIVLTMHVHEVIDDVFSVDIVKNTTDKPTSFRDSLIFLGYGTFVSFQQLMKLNPKAVRKYFHGELKLSTFQSVICSHIESPDSIYVIKSNKNVEHFERLKAEMTKEYKRSKSKRLIIYSPEIGIACAAPNTDNYWYRGIICDIPCEKMVEVFYVDIGIKRILSFDQIRKIQQKYMSIVTQAIQVRLKDVAPLSADRGRWNSNTKNFLTSYLSNIKVKAIAFSQNEMSTFCKSYDVCLYMMDETNFNAYLVGTGHAVSTGLCSQSGGAKKKRNNSITTLKSKKTLSTLSSDYCGSTLSISSRSERTVDDMDPFKLRVLILNVKSPDCIYVADPAREVIDSVLHEDLQKFYNNYSAIFEDPLEKDQLCAVYSAKDKQFFRARIIEFKSESQITVFFIDKALEETVSLDDIQPLDQKFYSAPRFQFKVKLAGVIPCGGSSTWPSVSSEKLCEIIYDNENCKFFISKVGEKVDDVIPVELWVKQSITEGPLVPTRIEIKSVSRMLVEKGHAIPIKGYCRDANETLAVEFKRQLNKSEESIDCSSKITWCKRNGYEDTLVDSEACSEIDFDSSGSDTLSESATEENESSNSVSLPPNMAAWLPAFPIKNDLFIGIPSYVDHDCFVYLHPKAGCNETLKWIQSELDKRYGKSKIKPYDKIWKEGDLCVAQYHNDKKWYRAQVKEIISKDTVQVEFVDYGNVEECQIGTLKKRVILGNIPIQCTKCVVHGLHPNTTDGRWPESHLDKIHSTIVDKEVEVKILDRTGSAPEILHVAITILKPERIDLVAYIYKELDIDIQNVNGSCTESESPPNSIMYNTVKRFQDELESKDVVIDGFLDDCEKHLSITSLESETKTAEEIKHPKSTKTSSETIESTISLDSLSWNEMVNKETRLSTSTPQVEQNASASQEDLNETLAECNYPSIIDFLDDNELVNIQISHICTRHSKMTEFQFCAHVIGGNKTIDEYYKQYIAMSTEIHETAKHQPIIENPEMNMQCYARYSQDNNWYRAVITKCEINPFVQKLDVTIKYVDYGNEEIIDATRIRQIHKKWTDLPVMAVDCRLHNIVPGTDLNKTLLAQKVISFFEEIPLFARIKDRQNRILNMDIFLDQNCTQPAFKVLIEEGLFKLKTKKD